MDEKKKGYMVMTPVGAFKSPNDPECREGNAANEVAYAAVSLFSRNAAGLKFLVAVHNAHYGLCESCKAANPEPDPRFTPEDVAEVKAYAESVNMVAVQGGSAVDEVLGALGVDESALREILASAIGEREHGCGGECKCARKRTIGFGVN